MKYYAISEVANKLQLNDKAVRAMIHRGEIPARRFGRCQKIAEEDLMYLFPLSFPGIEALPKRLR